MAVSHARSALGFRSRVSWTWPVFAGLLTNGACRSFDYCDADAACGGAAVAQTGGAAGNGDAEGGRSAGAHAGDAGEASEGGQVGSAGAWLVGGATAGDAGRAGAESVGEAGSGGAGASACQAPLADCDGSTFTVCETDLHSSPLHCGACQRRCMGACRQGSCLIPTLLTPGVVPVERGLIRVGEDWYGLTDDSLYTFKEGQQSPRVIQSGLWNLRALEAGPDRLYLGDDTQWWSVRYAEPEVIVDEGISALDARYMDGALYFIDGSQTVHWKSDSASLAVPYCLLPHPNFTQDSALLSRIDPGAPAVFRRGYADAVRSDVVACPAPTPASLAEPVLGRVIARGGERTHIGVAAGSPYWHDGSRLLGSDADGAEIVLFVAPADVRELGAFVIAGPSLLLSFEKDHTAGFFVIALDGASAPRAIGTLYRPISPYVDTLSDRLCYADAYLERVGCLAISALTTNP